MRTRIKLFEFYFYLRWSSEAALFYSFILFRFYFGNQYNNWWMRINMLQLDENLEAIGDARLRLGIYSGDQDWAWYTDRVTTVIQVTRLIDPIAQNILTYSPYWWWYCLLVRTACETTDRLLYAPSSLLVSIILFYKN